jgi:aryl-alcohol dehydrogenase-like predicted oxidoreductase
LRFGAALPAEFEKEQRMPSEQPNPHDTAPKNAAPHQATQGTGEIETIEIGGTDIIASRIALGTWAIGGWMWGGSDARSALRTIEAAIDHGINTIDTAPVYGFGLAEEIVGRALAPNGRRRRILVATKCGLEWHGNNVRRNASPERIRQEIEGSLKRLRTDYIDLYQLHWPDPGVPLEETAGALAKLLQDGKVRAIGVSNLDRAQTEQFCQVAPVRTTQPPYNLFERDIELDLLPYAMNSGLVVLAYGSLCRGLLSGRMNSATHFEGDDLRRVDPKFQQPRFNQYLAAVSALDRFARANFGKSVLALALRWILDRGPTIALWGARRPEQLDPIAEVKGWSLDEPAMQEVERILRDTITRPVGPEFMAPPSAAERAAA